MCPTPSIKSPCLLRHTLIPELPGQSYSSPEPGTGNSVFGLEFFEKKNLLNLLGELKKKGDLDAVVERQLRIILYRYGVIEGNYEKF